MAAREPKVPYYEQVANTLIEQDAFHPVHRKHHRRQSDSGLATRHLAGPVVEGVQINTTERDSVVLDGQEHPPDFLPGTMQIHDHR